jgi:ubiquinone/menaquinone biosynthesis C-methylase UbiE
VTLDEAVALIGPAVHERGGRWADLGAGSGTFTEALVHLLGPEGHVIAVERDRQALRELRGLAGRSGSELGAITVVDGDLLELDPLPGVAEARFDGILFANVLHFFADPLPLLEWAYRHLEANGRIVVVEYGSASPSRWVPYPVSIGSLRTLARTLGLSEPEVVAEKRSQFRGMLCCAVLERTDEESE